MSKIVILVTGAKGNTGNPIARHLLQKADKSKFTIRVSARKKEDVKELIDQGAEFVSIDFMDQKSLRDGLKVLSVVYTILLSICIVRSHKWN